MRNPFGCIDEMCRVWTKLDERSDWFSKKFKEINVAASKIEEPISF